MSAKGREQMICICNSLGRQKKSPPGGSLNPSVSKQGQCVVAKLEAHFSWTDSREGRVRGLKEVEEEDSRGTEVLEAGAAGLKE